MMINYHGVTPSTFNLDDIEGLPPAESDSWEEDQQYTLEVSDTEPTLTGYIFKGWSTDPSGSTVDYEPLDTYDFTTPGVLDLYTVWEVDKYTINFTAGTNGSLTGGTASVSNIPYGTYWNASGVTVPTPTPDVGYEFGSWQQALPSAKDRVTGDKTYTANFVPIDYTVVYDKNDGDSANVIDTQSAKQIGATVAIPTGQTIPGYTFLGWNTNKSATSSLAGFGPAAEDFTLNGAAINAFYQDGVTVTLYAIWSANTDTPYSVEHYKVNSSGEASHADSESLYGTTGETAFAVAKTTYTGYTYQPSYDKDGNKTVASGVVVAEGDSLVLKLYYTANPYNVSFDKNALGASGAMAGQTAYYNENLTLIENEFTRTGYDFVGWNTRSDGFGTPYADSANFEPWTLTSNLKLFAQWTNSTDTPFKVEHYRVSSAGTVKDFTENLKGTTNEVATAAIKSYEGYTYAPSYPGSLIAGIIAPDGSLVLKLYYLVNTYKVSFVDHDGKSIAIRTVEHGERANAPADPKRDGYTFNGWDKDSSQWASVKSDLEVKATYKINTYTVTFADYDGRVISAQAVNHGSRTNAPADPKRVGHTFTGWDKDSSAWANVKSDMTIRATYRMNTYTVTFEDYDGKVISAQSVAHGAGASSPVDPKRVGYTFTGWDKDSSVWATITSDLTIRATYRINVYTVTFVDYDDGVIKKQEVEYGKNATAPENPSREGYTFVSWSKTKSAWQNVSADVTIKAVYEKNPKPSVPTPQPTPTPTPTPTPQPTVQTQEEETYTVRYDGNGATSGSAPTDGNAYPGRTSAVVQDRGNLSKSGYSFEGWSTDPNARNASYRTGDRVSVNGNITLFAVWRQNESVSGTVIDTRDPATPTEGGGGDPQMEYLDGGAEVPGSAPPMSPGAGSAYWSLISLLLAIVSAVIVILAIAAAISRNGKEDEYLLQQEQAYSETTTIRRMYGTNVLSLIVSALAAVIGVIVFVIMNDLSGRMVLFNTSTIILAVLFAVTLICAKLAPRINEEDEWESEEALA
jgi:uncharacterized repeat protein (TIGR02543 family)